MIATKIVSESKKAEMQRIIARLSEPQVTIYGWPRTREEFGEPGNNPAALPFMKIGVGEG